MKLSELFKVAGRACKGKDVDWTITTQPGTFKLTITQRNSNSKFEINGTIPAFLDDDVITYITLNRVDKRPVHEPYPESNRVEMMIAHEINRMGESDGPQFCKDEYGNIQQVIQEEQHAPKLTPLWLTSSCAADAIMVCHAMMDQHKKTEMFMHQVMRYLRKVMSMEDTECK